MIEARQLSGGYTQFNVKEVNLSVERGQFVAILGPNGSGKTTLLKLLSGALAPKKGEVLLKGKPLNRYSTKEKAKLISVLGQEEQVAFDFTVEEVVALGRYPHQKGWFGLLSPQDRKKIEEALVMTRLVHLRHHPFYQLSGGEKQRVLLAKALAQEAEALFLDEPTNHLDINFTIEMLDLLKTWQQSKGLTIVAILHDVNVAALYADRLALMQQGQLQLVEEIDQLKDAGPLEQLYTMKVEPVAHPRLDRPQFMYTSQQCFKDNKTLSLADAYQLKQNKHFFHLHFKVPFKVMSNCQWGSGIRWARHFCHFFLSHDQRDADWRKGIPRPEERLEGLLHQWGIPPHQAAGAITYAQLEHYVLVEKQVESPLLAVITVACPTEDVKSYLKASVPENKLVSVMLFIDGFLDDGALVQGLIVAEQAKSRAMAEQGILPAKANGANENQDREIMMIAVTQRGKGTMDSGIKPFYQTVDQLVYQAVKKALLSVQSVVKQ